METNTREADVVRTFFPLDFYVPAVHKAPLLDAKDSKAALPIVVFSHGLSAMRTIYSMVHCDLASHGYIVAAVEHK